MSKRVGWEGADEEQDSGDLNEAQQEVRAFADEKKRQKKQRRGQEVGAARVRVDPSLTRAQDDDEEEEAGPAPDGEEGEDEADVMFERRADGTKRIVGVDGEEKALYRQTDLAELEREMGTKLEPFNLKAEMEEGHFDAEGHYIERGFGQSDAWLQEMDVANANVVGGPRSRFIKPLQLEEQPEEDKPQKPASVAELAAWGGQLCAFLRDDEETVAGALKRLAQERREARKKTPQKKATGGDAQFAKPVARQRDGDAGGEQDAFDRASTLADKLQSAGLAQPVFGMRRTDLLQWRRGAKVFEYVIRGGSGGADGSDSEIFGPFSGDNMNAWKQQGYFDSGKVEICIKIGPQRGVFRPAATFNIDKELAAL
jgi:CD2 antigen cytoplasmic tail-binding protein 2